MVIYYGEYVLFKGLEQSKQYLSVCFHVTWQFRNFCPAEQVKIGMKLAAVIFHSKTFFQFSAPSYFRKFLFKDSPFNVV